MIPISSPFGWRRNPVTGARHFHAGVDLPAPRGTPVVAPAAGRVSRVDVDGVGKGQINGNAVHLVTDEGLRWAFLHLSSVDVAAGGRVRRGQRLGRVGSTGRSTGPHLHLQVTWRGEPIDPVALYPRGTFFMV